jgi:hypothetical protein
MRLECTGRGCENYSPPGRETKNLFVDEIKDLAGARDAALRTGRHPAF